MIGVTVGLVGLAVTFSLSKHWQPSNVAKNITLYPSVMLTPKAVDITGTWNSEQAKKIVLTRLQNFNWKTTKDFCVNGVGERPDSCKPFHSLIGEYYLQYKDSAVEIVVTTTIENENGENRWYHASAPYLSFFLFEKLPIGWKLVNSSIAALRFGSWGKVRSEGVNVYVIGDNIYGIQLENGYTGQGTTITYTSIYAIVGDSFREVFNLKTSESNSGGIVMKREGHTTNGMPLTDWDSKLEFQPCTTGFCDLLLLRSGIREENSFQEKELFKFNGQKYVTSRLYR